MKLFVWNEPYPVSYGSACLYVLAETEEEAREKALTAVDCSYGTPYADGRTIKVDKLGKPTRVIEGPYAEVNWWQE